MIVRVTASTHWSGALLGSHLGQLSSPSPVSPLDQGGFAPLTIGFVCRAGGGERGGGAQRLSFCLLVRNPLCEQTTAPLVCDLELLLASRGVLKEVLTASLPFSAFSPSGF